MKIFFSILSCILSIIFLSIFISYEFDFLRTWSWFGADFPRVISDVQEPSIKMTAHRHRHPLFSLLTAPLILFIDNGFNSILLSSMTLRICANGIQTYLLFIIFLNLGLSNLKSSVLMLIYFSTSTFIFWAGVFETFGFGSLSITWVIYLCSIKEKNYFL